MRRVIFLCLVIGAFFLSGCTPLEYSSVDDQYYWRTNWNRPIISEAQNGHYYYSLTDSKVYYVDQSGESVILCARPDCQHRNDSTCNAYFPYTGKDTGVFATETNLYIFSATAEQVYAKNAEGKNVRISVGPSLYGISRDGSTRERLLTFDKSANYSFPIVHRNYFFTVQTTYNDQADKTVNIQMYSLAKSASSPQTLYSLDDPNAVITQFMAYQNSLYFCVAKDSQSGLLYKLDFETGDLTELPLPSEKYVQYFMLQGSKMYFSLLSTSTAFETQSNMELWECGTDLTQSQYVGLLNIGDLSCDEEYIYVTQASDIWIYDHEANLADELLLEEQFQSAPTFINLYVSNSDALFLWAKLPNTNAPSLYLGSKKDLGAAKFAFRHLNIPAD